MIVKFCMTQELQTNTSFLLVVEIAKIRRPRSFEVLGDSVDSTEKSLWQGLGQSASPVRTSDYPGCSSKFF